MASTGTDSERAESPEGRLERPSQPQNDSAQPSGSENQVQSLTSVTSPKFFRFLALPAEIRLMIYSLLLLFPEEWIYITASRRKPPRIHHRNHSKTFGSLSPVILLTCHQIKLEATTVLYGRNGFRNATKNMGACWFLNAIGHRNSTLIRRGPHIFIGFDHEIYDEEQTFVMCQNSVELSRTTAKSYPNLEVITMGFDCSIQLVMDCGSRETSLEHFKLVVQHFKNTFPKLERVVLHGFADWDYRDKSDNKLTLVEMRVFLEENGWTIENEE